MIFYFYAGVPCHAGVQPHAGVEPHAGVRSHAACTPAWDLCPIETRLPKILWDEDVE